ncbi:hypothetical protein DL89DRAFT_268134 [Linderina pennispora]|uniref:C2H2-type domain-containing protein n=1 Tax=Linderina pennispora TaxID=61395 RepID=A0A1Y1W7H1_9FUNG|nr:uncharacterized protein DL89DRAFT_268134 [Linderina pennispora]ORX69104.1 hypothetical protein DL89DRAFT_268134 [Linderina pennispora]
MADLYLGQRPRRAYSLLCQVMHLTGERQGTHIPEIGCNDFPPFCFTLGLSKRHCLLQTCYKTSCRRVVCAKSFIHTSSSQQLFYYPIPYRTLFAIHLDPLKTTTMCDFQFQHQLPYKGNFGVFRLYNYSCNICGAYFNTVHQASEHVRAEHFFPDLDDL